VGIARLGKAAGALRSAGKGNRRRERAAASLGKYGTAVADPDTYAYSKSNSIDLADSVRVALTDSDVQRDTVSHVTTVNSSDIRVSDAVAQRNVLAIISYE